MAIATPDMASLVAAEHALRRAQFASDADTLARLLDDALVFTGPDGRLYGKTDDLSLHRSGNMRLTKLEPSEERVELLGDVGVIVVRMEMAGVFQGTAFSGPYRYTRVWQHVTGGWRLVAGHVSAVAG